MVNKKINSERLIEIIRKPIITEKSAKLSENNQIVFEVCSDSTKIEIKEAVETLFKVTVNKVLTYNRVGKRKIFRNKPGRTKSVRRAVVSLKQGDTIDLNMGVK